MDKQHIKENRFNDLLFKFHVFKKNVLYKNCYYWQNKKIDLPGGVVRLAKNIAIATNRIIGNCHKKKMKIILEEIY